MVAGFNPEDTAQFNPFEHNPSGLGALPPAPPIESHFREIPAEILPAEPKTSSADWRRIGKEAVLNWQPPARRAYSSGKSGQPFGPHMPRVEDLRQSPLPFHYLKQD